MEMPKGKRAGLVSVGASAVFAVFTPTACGPAPPPPAVSPAVQTRSATRTGDGSGDVTAACVLSLRNPAEVLPGTWDAVYTDRDGTGEDPPYTGPRTFSLRIWKTADGLSGTMSYPVTYEVYETVTLPTTSISIVGAHVTATAAAPAHERVITVQGSLQCPGPVLDANKTVSTDPDVTPLRFEKQPGS